MDKDLADRREQASNDFCAEKVSHAMLTPTEDEMMSVEPVFKPKARHAFLGLANEIRKSADEDHAYNDAHAREIWG